MPPGRRAPQRGIALVALLTAAALGGCVAEAPPAPDDLARADTTAAPTTPTDPAASGADPSGTPHLTSEGWGPLRIGMTRAQVVSALGEDANPGSVGGPEPDACDQWRPARAPDGMLVMIERGRLTRITLIRDSPVTTQAGFGVGADRAAIQAAYGERAEVTPHKYVGDDAGYITVWSAGPDTAEPRGIVYEIGADGRVSHIHAGGPSIRYVEGCL